jgi:hypothetical protein
MARGTGQTLADSKPDFIGQPEAPEGAPNVLVVMLDDAGYSNASSFGGVMKTPTFDRIGDEGIRYTHMSVAAVCSPTRGSLLTGYNVSTRSAPASSPSLPPVIRATIHRSITPHRPLPKS